MLYEIAHVIKARFGFLWDAIEWGNAEVFALLHRGGMARIPELLADCSDRYHLRMLSEAAMREQMQQNARPMIGSRFEKGFVQGCLIEFYKEIMR